MPEANVVGLDPSLRNWGIALGTYNAERRVVSVSQVEIVQPVLPKGKTIRQSSKDLEASFQLMEGILPHIKNANAIFVEVPVGSQNARSMASYGVCIGILGAIRALGIPFFEVTPTEVKLAAVGKKTATKGDMIHWAADLYPTINWPKTKVKGIERITAAKAEHMADAIGAIHAGMQTPEFQQAIRFLEGADITH